MKNNLNSFKVDRNIPDAYKISKTVYLTIEKFLHTKNSNEFINLFISPIKRIGSTLSTGSSYLFELIIDCLLISFIVCIKELLSTVLESSTFQ